MMVTHSTHSVLSLMSVVTSVMALKAHPSQILSLKPRISVEVYDQSFGPDYRYDRSETCVIRYESLEVRVERSGHQEKCHIEIKRETEDEIKIIAYNHYGELVFRTIHKEPSNRGAYPLKEKETFGLTYEFRAHYPLAVLYDQAMAIFEARGVTKSTCTEVAAYIENNPRGPFKNEGARPWLYQFLLDPGFDKYYGY
ncbi:hypothetical protein FOZ60_006905 [Perkinsus olseni]|uniref:Uncharacterized protein n=1 Tax=Perkinsus olseni TaxID=32597 RepID=A0A7J6NMG3_PEROL|nr:hypothetical protein FOZ60_006905 [Perkinsus olseni]KAF4734691.1 hypothetical protein FOZ62_005470 [Perkinsus olseni]